jgi:hypothetical protein
LTDFSEPGKAPRALLFDDLFELIEAEDRNEGVKGQGNFI